jgi:hypothetical protein
VVFRDPDAAATFSVLFPVHNAGSVGVYR